MKFDDHGSLELDPAELHQLQMKLHDWTFAGQHHMHKSWRFVGAQQALKWHGLAKSSVRDIVEIATSTWVMLEMVGLKPTFSIICRAI